MVGHTKPSLASIASELGVSTASVSNALRRPERVSADLRSRVLEVATRIGYAGPIAAARFLPRGRTDTIGVLFTAQLTVALRDPAAVAFLEGLAAVCESAARSVLLLPDAIAQEGVRKQMVADALVDGFIVYSLRDHDPLLPAVLRRAVPTVIVDAPRSVVGADWVGVDDRSGARVLGEYLRQQGHRAVGMIAPQLHESRLNGAAEPPRWRGGGYALMRERIEGLLAGLELPAEAVPIEERVDATSESGADALHALLDRRPELTAVCCLTDVLALGALAAARRRGLGVPAEMTITGFDDIPESARAGLTTVAQPLIEKGQAAGELLVSAGTQSEDRRRLLSTALQVRASSAALTS
jgi:DNA-binding LacI/PurR family transcriptional regulator